MTSETQFGETHNDIIPQQILDRSVDRRRISGGLLFGVTAASAGECPAGKVVASDGQKPGATAHKGVTEKLLGQLDLAKEKVALADRHFRMRRLEIAPGGEVAWHSHDERPALIYVVSGTITEDASTRTLFRSCMKPAICR